MTSKWSKMRSATLALLLLSALVVSAERASAADNRNLEKVVMVLPSPPGVAHAAYFAAEALGYYAQEGLTVELSNVTGGQDANRVVASGQAQFSFPAQSSVMLARKAGLPIVSVFTQRQRWIFGFSSLPDSGLTKIGHLEGKKVGVYSQSQALMAQLMFAGAGMDPDKVDIIVVGGNLAGVLTSRRVDAVLSWSALVSKLKASGVEQNWIDAPEFDDYQSNVLATSEEIVKQKPKLVEGFLRGTVKGMTFVRENPEAALAIVAKAEPNSFRDPKEGLEELKIEIEHGQSALTEKHGFGYQNPLSWEKQQAVLFKLGQLTKEVDPKTNWTNDFIEAANDFDVAAVANDAKTYRP